jgi:8-oxo-dGTP pyrophosphatase MutT (NUDIX family)
MPKDYSYGVIPVYKNEAGELSVLLVGKHDPVTGELWFGFPKGHAEQGERPSEAALRELQEETGLSVTRLSDKTYSDHYHVSFNDSEFSKTVIYFIGQVTSTDVTVDGEEITDYRWTPLHLVDHFITRTSTQVMYCHAEHDIEQFIHATQYFPIQE